MTSETLQPHLAESSNVPNESFEASGIFSITCLPTSESYVGFTSDAVNHGFNLSKPIKAPEKPKPVKAPRKPNPLGKMIAAQKAIAKALLKYQIEGPKKKPNSPENPTFDIDL